MNGKRTRVDGSAFEPAPAALVTEVFDLLLESSRKELAALLSVLVKASGKQALEAVRADAIKRGAYVANKPSRYQQCNHAMLDAFFSWLHRDELRTVDVVCRRWRSATTNSNAGWIAALARVPVVDGKWTRQMLARRLRPSQFPTLKKLRFGFNADLSVIRQLPSVTSLHVLGCINDYNTTAFTAVLQQLPLRKLTIERGSIRKLLEGTALAGLGASLTLVDMTADADGLLAMLKLPKLKRLSISTLTKSYLPSGPAILSASLTDFTIHGDVPSIFITRLLSRAQLPSILRFQLTSIRDLDSAATGALSALQTLTSLILPECDWRAHHTHFTQLVALQRLHIRRMDTLQELSPLPQLRALCVMPSRLSLLSEADSKDNQEFFQALHNMSSIRELQLAGVRLQPGIIPTLPATLTSLTMTSLAKETASVETLLKELSNYLPALQELKFTVSHVHNSNVEAFAGRLQSIKPSVTVKY